MAISHEVASQVRGFYHVKRREQPACAAHRLRLKIDSDSASEEYNYLISMIKFKLEV